MRDLTDEDNMYTMEVGEVRKEAGHGDVFTLLFCISYAYLVGS